MSLIAHLQLVHNAAAWLLTGMRKREPFTPILAPLHWLPVKFRIYFIMIHFVTLAGHVPQYISCLFLQSLSRTLISVTANTNQILILNM